jgi:hypothetical protein
MKAWRGGSACVARGRAHVAWRFGRCAEAGWRHEVGCCVGAGSRREWSRTCRHGLAMY